MELGLKGKVALVTAASKGIGRACARALASEGVQVVICARTEADLIKTAREIASTTGNQVHPIVADVAKLEDVQRLVAESVSIFGSIDILVSNAGGPPAGCFDEITDAQWHAAFELNLLSVVRLMREVLPHMRRRRWGRIISIQSSSVRQPIDGLVLSNGIRPGVVGLVKTMAGELGRDNILVNTISPGRILTDRLRSRMKARAQQLGRPFEELLAEETREIPLARIGDPEELASTVVFLASERASYITGATIPVDGGLIRSLP